MSEPFLAEIKLASFDFPPRGWAFCDGRLLQISQYQALFSLLGTQYGGDGKTTFALPDLRGRVPINIGNGFANGNNGGEESHTLTIAEIPNHTHAVTGTTNPGGEGPVGNVWATVTENVYSSGTPDASMSGRAIANAGESQPHDNMPPFLVLNYIIALQGILPPRS